MSGETILEKQFLLEDIKESFKRKDICYSCKWLNKQTDKCTLPTNKGVCDGVTEILWEWRGVQDD